MSRRLIVPAFILVAGLPLLAQQGPDSDPDAAQGYVNNVFHHSDVDSINLYNGQLTVPIAVGPSYPIGPKLKFQAMLTYTSRAWEYGHPSYEMLHPEPSLPPTAPFEPLLGDPALGIGWNFNLGAIKPCGLGQGSRCYVSRDGAEHHFSQPVSPSSFKTADADQLLLHAINDLTDASLGYEMWDGDGNHYVFGSHVTGFDDSSGAYIHDFGRGRDGWYLTSLTDPFGNAITVAYYSRVEASPCPSFRSDCLNTSYSPDTSMRCAGTGANSWVPRAIQLPGGVTISIGLDTQPGTAQMIKTFTFPVFPDGQADSAIWTLSYQPDTWYSDYCSVPLLELASIELPATLPGAPKYLFEYASTADGILAHTVLLTKMTVPTGASIGYDYGDYSFYHGRVAALNPGCTPKGPPADAWVIKSSPLSGNRPNGPTPNLPIDPCVPAGWADGTYLDAHAGVLRKTEVIPAVSGPPLTAVTNYTQYALPFGEQGTSGTDQSQSLTVIVGPPDIDNHVVARSYLFWAGPRSGSFQHCPGYAPLSPCPGDRTGGELREAVYDHDPNTAASTGSIAMPSCGGNDLEFCPSHAVRVVQRTYDYDDPETEFGNRRLQSEITYNQASASNGFCSGCKYHQVEFLPREADSVGAWEAAGRHYATETHTGNLGNDSRTTTTTWTPSTAPWFPNLFDKRETVDATGTQYQYFDYDHTAQANGFLRGTLTWDSGRGLLFADCRYTKTSQGVVDTHGNVASRYTGTFSWTTEPDPHTCSTATLARPDPASWGGNAGNGDIFATDFTYQNGQRVSARAVNGSAQGGWLKYDVTRDSKTGWITSSRDTAGLQASYLYDSLGRPTRITPPGETATIVSYPTSVQTIATRDGGAGVSTYEEYDFDGLGRTVRERRLMPGSRYAKRFTKFDSAGHDYFRSEWVDDATLETVSGNLSASCSFSTGPFSTFRPTSAPGAYRLCYDPFGRPQQVVGSMHSSLQTISRVDGSVFYSDTQETATTGCVNGTYSGGSCSGGTDSTTTTRGDAFGRITSVTEPGGDVTSYLYDVNGKLASVAQGAQSGTFGRSFSYDRFGFLRSETTPDKGAVTYDTIGSLGNVLQETEPGNLVLSRSFDYAGRLTSVSSNESRTYVTNTYDEASRGSSLGKLTTSVSTNYPPSGQSTVTDSFWYAGAGGRPSTKTTAVSTGGLPELTESFYYNSLGLISGHVHPRPETPNTLPFVVATEYDQGLPVRQYLNGLQLVKSVSYQPSGGLAGYTTGLGIGYDVTTTISQDGYLPRPSRIQTSGASSTFDSGVYGYDGAGNIRAMGGDTFSYDSRSRLMRAEIPLDGPKQEFTYDRFGNMLSRTGVNAQSFTIDSPTNHVVGYGYLRGNLTGPSGSPSYAWDGLDRMTSQTLGSWTYLYNAANERVGKQPQGLAWTFTLRGLDNRVSTEFSGSTPSRDNVFLGNLLVASYANIDVGGNNWSWSFYSSDHLGTPRFVTHIDVSDTESHKFWPYGDEVQPQTAPQRLRFAAMERDDESSRFYDHARHHDFGLARFLGPDQLSGRPGDAQSWNRYAYARNNPLKYTDPNGQEIRLAGDTRKALHDVRQLVPNGARGALQLSGKTLTVADSAAGRGTENFDRLRSIAGRSEVLEINTSAATFTSTNSELNKGATFNKQDDYKNPEGLLGMTLSPSESLTGNAQVFVSPFLTGVATSETLSHELVHAAFQLEGLPNQHIAVPAPDGQGFIEKNRALGDAIKRAIEDASRNFNPFSGL